MKQKYKVFIEGQPGDSYTWKNESGTYVVSSTNSPFEVTEGELRILQRNIINSLRILEEGEYE